MSDRLPAELSQTEIDKLLAERRKLLAEEYKLIFEGNKLRREHYLAPILTAATVAAAVATLITAIIHFLTHPG